MLDLHFLDSMATACRLHPPTRLCRLPSGTTPRTVVVLRPFPAGRPTCDSPRLRVPGSWRVRPAPRRKDSHLTKDNRRTLDRGSRVQVRACSSGLTEIFFHIIFPGAFAFSWLLHLPRWGVQCGGLLRRSTYHPVDRRPALFRRSPNSRSTNGPDTRGLIFASLLQDIS